MKKNRTYNKKEVKWDWDCNTFFPSNKATEKKYSGIERVEFLVTYTLSWQTYIEKDPGTRAIINLRLEFGSDRQ